MTAIRRIGLPRRSILMFDRLSVTQAQMAGYVVLIVHVDKPEAGKFSIYSVTLAMFLIGSISASDVRVAVTMIFWSNSGLRRVFGVLLLCSAALLVLATIRILFNSDDGTADMVIDAANVLFIAEVVRITRGVATPLERRVVIRQRPAFLSDGWSSSLEGEGYVIRAPCTVVVDVSLPCCESSGLLPLIPCGRIRESQHAEVILSTAIYGFDFAHFMTFQETFPSPASFVLHAALSFIFELCQDAQVMLFLHGIPQRWRLFSLLEIMGISFWLALITIVHIGDTNATVPYLTDTTMGVHEIVLPFYAFAFTPGTLTMVAFLINFLVTSIPVPTDSDGVPRVRLTHSIGMASRLIVSGIYAFVVDDLIFALALLAWVAFGSALAAVVSLNILLRDEIPGRFILELVCVVAACFVVGSLFILHRKFGARETPNGSPNESSPTSIAASLPRWSVLFVGWGFGSVISGFLMISTRTEPVVTLVGAIPIFLSGIFLFAEPEILGPTIGGFLKPAAAMLGDSRSVLHWSLASSLHFLMVSWVTDFAAYSYFRVIR